MKYTLSSKAGHVFGVYEGATPEEAIRAMMEDAGEPDGQADGIFAEPVKGNTLTLAEIYQDMATYVRSSGFHVTIWESLGHVLIAGDERGEDIFLQNDEGYEYIEEARNVWEKAGDLGLEDAFTGHAKQYIDSLLM